MPRETARDNGVLWVEYPNESGESLPLSIELQGTPQFYRHHSSKLAAAELPWVHASGVEGADGVAISLITTASKNAAAGEQPAPTPPNSVASPATPYRVQLYFTEPKNAQPGERVFDVFLQGKLVLPDFDIAAEQTPLPPP